MKDTLSTIQKLFKAGQILSMIVFVAFVVSAALSLIAIIGVAAGIDGVAKVGNVQIRGLVSGEGMTTVQILQQLIAGTLVGAGQAVVAWFARIYFKNELEAGTPFTYEGAQEIKRLGILAIAVPIGTAFVAGIIIGIIGAVYAQPWSSQIGQESTVTMGILFLVMSLIFKYGAGLVQQGKEEQSPAVQEQQ